jgi:hypothetical protein
MSSRTPQMKTVAVNNNQKGGEGNMRNLRIQLGLTAVVLAMLTVIGGVSPAMAWPDKPIAVYVGWSAGGSSDTTTRRCVWRWRKSWAGAYW